MTHYTRRAVLAGAGVGAFAITAWREDFWPFSTSQSSPASCYWNIQDSADLDPEYWAYLAALEEKIGRRFAGFRKNGTGPSAITESDRQYDTGRRWAYINGKPSPAGTYAGYWADTARGVYDSYWREYFAGRKADARWTGANPIHFSYHHEQSAASEGGGLANGPPSDYIAAFRHVRGLMDATGAHVSRGGNMQMCWVPHWLQVAKPASPFHAPKCDPGRAYYDVFGADIYNTADSTHTAAEQWKPVHEYAMLIGKPFITGETGIAGTDAYVLRYLRDLDALLKGWGSGGLPGQVYAICWTSRVADGGDYRHDATTTRLSWYRMMALDPFYGRVVDRDGE
jgi:hypothetical protein